MLRIDVNVAGRVIRAATWCRPTTRSSTACRCRRSREIWSFGLRNPWRFTFDDLALGGTGALVIGDVGQGAWEEIDYEPRGRGGRNYGWRNREGRARPHPAWRPRRPAFTPLIEPIYEYAHGDGAVDHRRLRLPRRGARRRRSPGRYFFADFI